MPTRPPVSDEELAEYLASRIPPSNQELSRLLAQTRWVLITSPRAGQAPVEVHDAARIAELRDCLAIVEPESEFLTMGRPSATLELHDGSRLLESIHLHLDSIHSASWNSHAMLRDSGKLSEWLEACGVTVWRRPRTRS